MYNKLCEKGAALGVWLLPWPHFQRGCKDPRGFITGDPFIDKNANIPTQYEPKLKLMLLKIHGALSYHDDCLPPQGMVVVANSNNCGYTALYNMQREFNPSLVKDASLLSLDLPFQKEGELFDAWSRQTMYHRAMLAFLDDTILNLNDFLTQNKFINKL